MLGVNAPYRDILFGIEQCSISALNRALMNLKGLYCLNIMCHLETWMISAPTKSGRFVELNRAQNVIRGMRFGFGGSQGRGSPGMAIRLSVPAPRPSPVPVPALARAAAACVVTALGEVLVERKMITTEQLETALAHQLTTNRRLGHVLIDLGFTNADAVLGALSLQLGVPSTRLNGYGVDAHAVRAVPEKLARKHTAVPLQKVGQVLQIAIAVPNDLQALDDLRFASGCQIQTFVALEDEIAAAVDRFYGGALLVAVPDVAASLQATPPVPAAPYLAAEFERRDRGRVDRRQGGRRATDSETADPMFDPATEQTAVRTADQILTSAASAGASDIHLERTPDSM